MKYLTRGMDIVNQYVHSGKIPGACCAFVSREGTEIAHAGYQCVLPKPIPNHENTIYDMASCTKVIATTTIALQLLEQGYLSLDSSLAEFLPDFPFKDITIQQILSHSSGICHDDKQYKACHGQQEMWEFIKSKPLEFNPGTEVVYSDFGFVALGFALQKLIGPLDQYASEHIFKPLGMNRTMYRPRQYHLEDQCASTEATADRGIICGDVHDGKAYRLDGVSGNAGLFSTAADVALFAKMMLNDGVLGNARILSRSTVHLLHRCYTENLSARRTLGWIVNDPQAPMGDYYSANCLFHTGFTGTSIYIDYDRGCAVILLSNRIHPSRDNPYIRDLRNRFHNQVLLAWDNTH